MNDHDRELPRATILVVDDTPENLMVLGRLLRPLYRVRVAPSGIQALRIAESEPRPDLILLDVMMPGMDGYEVIRRLRANPATGAIPIIFVTAMDGADDEELGLKLGAVDYIAKPIKPAIVLARVSSQLELKRARDWLKDRNTLLEAEVRRRMRDNQRIQDISIRALASLAETRDNETGNHIRRTQAYVGILAERLRAHPGFAGFLTESMIDMVVKSAPLHDIGKVGIPDGILLKPGRLDRAEFETMKNHCRIGGDAIDLALRGEPGPEATIPTGIGQAPLDFLGIARDIALWHHEKWDGSGYPDGLAGATIPIPARLMAVADVFDALVSRRIYKTAIPFGEAVRLIEDGRGSHFDPDVVDAFLADLDRFAAVLERFADSDETLSAKRRALGMPG